MTVCEAWASRIGTGTLRSGLGRLVARDRAMRMVVALAGRLSHGHEPILLTGETGTGKTLLARAIHEQSGRTGRFVKLHVAGLSDGSLLSEIQGQDGQGAWPRAWLGTLLLDEVGTLGPRSLVELIRLVREGHGPGDPGRPRLVLATNLPDDSVIRLQAGGETLRELFIDSAVMLPPLRRRPEDLPLLVECFLEDITGSLGVDLGLSAAEVGSALRGYPFPGNVRELRSIVTEAVCRHLAGADPFEGIRCRLAALGMAEDGDAADPAQASPSSSPTPPRAPAPSRAALRSRQ